MTACRCSETDFFWKLVDEIHATSLVAGAIGAARSQVEYSRAQNAARRSDILLGKNAGQEHAYRAELLFRARRAQLQEVKQSFAQFASGIDKNQRKRISDFLRAEGLKELVDDARKMVLLGLLDADLSPEESQKAVKSLDGTLETIATLTSFEKLTRYMNQHLDDLIAKALGNPSANQGLCVLILVITSIFAVLVLIAALICVLTLGLGCQGVLQRLIDQACPP
jgi:hypothetical protein